jgi:non-ribosomal peptide synthetase component F
LDQIASESHSYVPIPANLTSGVADFCKKLCITRSVFVQVAWALTLSQLTGNYEVCFGYLASGRYLPVDGIDNMVGPLANLLVSRINLGTSAKQVLKTTSEKSMEHLSIQHVSLAKIQHELGFSGKRLFNTSLSIRGSDKFKSYEKRSLSFEPYNGEDPHEVFNAP